MNILKSTYYSEQNDKCWHTVRGVCKGSYSGYAGVFVDKGTWGNIRSRLAAAIVQAYVSNPVPAEVIKDMVYAASEQEVISALQEPLMDYVEEARAMFISGAMDPNSDSDWNTYLNNLKSLGIDDLLAAVQKTYTAMTAE